MKLNVSARKIEVACEICGGEFDARGGCFEGYLVCGRCFDERSEEITARRQRDEELSLRRLREDDILLAGGR